MIPSLYINLDQAVKRRKFIESQGAKLGIDFIRVPAVQAAQIPPDVLDIHRRGATRRRPLKATEIACGLSHREAWRQACKLDSPFAAIFEDDVHFSINTKAFLDHTDWIPEDADIVKIETYYFHLLLKRPFLKTVHGYELARLNYTHLGTGGYLIRRSHAERLLDATADFQSPIDYEMFKRGRMALPQTVNYQLVPAICIQENRLLATPDYSQSADVEQTSIQPNGPNWNPRDTKNRPLRKRLLLKLFTALDALQRFRTTLTGDFWGVVDFR